MKAMVVYDSVHGNTEKIARAMGEALGGDVEVVRADTAHAAQLQGLDLLVVGAPTHGGQASPAMREFLKRVQGSGFLGIRAPTFDTRLTNRLLTIFGYAAGRIAGALKREGATLLGTPGGFFVLGPEGPLKEGELERAAAWARDIAAANS